MFILNFATTTTCSSYSCDNPFFIVFSLLKKGQWLTLEEISKKTGFGTASISARLRDFRKEKFFQFGYTPSDIINIKGSINSEKMDSIKRELVRRAQGTSNAFKILLLNAPEGVEILKTSQLDNDMAWREWINYLIKIIALNYGLSPSELNFDVTNENGRSGLSDSGYRNDSVLKETKNSSFKPLLRWIESIINSEILPLAFPELSKKYQFHFVGIDSEDIDSTLERIKKKVSSYMTINEIRKEEGLEPLGPWADVVLDSIAWQSKEKSEEQKAKESLKEDDSSSLISLLAPEEETKTQAAEEEVFEEKIDDSELPEGGGV